MQKTEEAVKVAVRCRPMNSTEKAENCNEVVLVEENRGEIFVKNPQNPSVYLIMIY